MDQQLETLRFFVVDLEEEYNYWLKTVEKIKPQLISNTSKIFVNLNKTNFEKI